MHDAFWSSDEFDERAHQLYNEAQYDEAVEVLRQGLHLYPDAVELHIGMGYARLAREEFAWARRAFADALVKSARSGYDFATLARKYSIDTTRDKGGDLGTRKPGGFGKAIDLAILRLDVNQVSEPLVYGNKLMIVKVTDRKSVV